MKKLTGLLVLLFLFQAQVLYAANWMVRISSNKDSYELGEKAVFGIKITKNRKWANDKIIVIEASFPDQATKVSLVKIKKGRYRFKTVLESSLAEQILAVKIYKRKGRGRKGALLAEAFKMITVINSYTSSFSIKEGSHTSNNGITLEIDSVASYEITVSEDSMFTDAQWQPYAAVIPFVL